MDNAISSELHGRVAIVTGAGSGIGAATAYRLASDGCKVVVADINDQAGMAVVESIRQVRREAIFIHCDVSDSQDWIAVATEARVHFGRIDIVHNNATYASRPRPTHELPEDEWDRELTVTLKQIFLSVRACMPELVTTRGTMINTSSTHALMGFSRQAAYDAAKGAVCSLTRELAAEYGPNVRVNAVLPGAILTPAWAEVREEERLEHELQSPAKRLGRPEEVASVVAFLASDNASFITGASIVVDGGWSITKYFDSDLRRRSI